MSIFSAMPYKLHIFTFSIILTECSIAGSIFTIRLSFLGRKSIREYFTCKLGAFCDFFPYVGESRIIKTPININFPR